VILHKISLEDPEIEFRRKEQPGRADPEKERNLGYKRGDWKTFSQFASGSPRQRVKACAIRHSP
jgi:hypothetical protein